MAEISVISHVVFEGLGHFEELLVKRGHRLRHFRASRPAELRSAGKSSDLLIVLGGPISANDEQNYPFLIDELSLLEDRLSADMPTFGICLGAQLIARALGARVNTGKPEIGWFPLTLATPDTPGYMMALGDTPVLHWHGESFDLPDGATHLASSAACENQAFAWSKSTLAVQFHPEAAADDLEEWYVGHTVELNGTPGVEINKLRRDALRFGPGLREKGGRFFKTWLDQIGL